MSSQKLICVLGEHGEEREWGSSALKPVDELQWEFFFNKINNKGICYLIERQNIHLSKNMLEKPGILAKPINNVCNVLYSSLDTPISVLMASGMENFPPVFKVNLGHHTIVKAHLPVSPDEVKELF